ncbi:MAG: hypothetical protein ACRDV8_10285, partial [Acidimicrobiales bacterium]
MRADERVLDRRRPKLGFNVLAVLAVFGALGSTLWGYVEYAQRARTTELALSVAATFFCVAAAVLLAFRATFLFREIQAPRPSPPAAEAELDLGVRQRRGFVALLVAAGSSLLALLLLPLRSMGTWPRADLQATSWRRGVRLLTTGGVPLRPAELPPGSATVVWPDGHPDDSN